MPYSSTVFDRKIAELLKKINPKKVYDFGAGAGKYGKMVKEQMDGVHSVAIEIDPEYIDRFQLRDIYTEVWNLSIMDLLTPNYYDVDFDTVIVGDAIEHLRKSDGMDLLNFLVYRSRWILVQYPVKYLQNGVEGKSQEAHISVWGKSDFASFDVVATFKKGTQRLVLIKGYLD